MAGEQRSKGKQSILGGERAVLLLSIKKKVLWRKVWCVRARGIWDSQGGQQTFRLNPTCKGTAPSP